MVQKIKRKVLVICVITLFCGCSKIEYDKIAGTKWRSAIACTPANEFIYIHFKDNAIFEYCLVDYDLNKLGDMKESSYIRTDNSSIVFSANDVSLQSANFGSGGWHGGKVLIFFPTRNKKTLTLAFSSQVVVPPGGGNGNGGNGDLNSEVNRRPSTSGQNQIVECVKINKKPK